MSVSARPLLSVAIVARNEEANLLSTLPTLAAIADEIVLVDSGSTDETIAVAERFGARVLHQDWLGFAQQKNFAIAQCTNDWILLLDADEALSNELADTIPRTLMSAAPNLSGFSIARRNYFLGRPMLHGGEYPDYKLRLFRRNKARFQERFVHESMVADGPVETLAGDLLHHAYPTLELYIEHMNRYSSLGSEELLNLNRRSRFFRDALLRPICTFFYNFVCRGGFLDGKRGLLLHLYHSAYVSWKYAKVWHGNNP